MGYLGKIKQLNNFTHENKIPLTIDGVQTGFVRQDYLDYFLKSGIFCLHEEGITLDPRHESFEARTEALEIFAKKAFSDGITNSFMSEPYGVRAFESAEVKCLADRSVASLLGIISFGQHLNGYVKTADGLKMWIAKRAYNKGYYPGMLDHLVAGGLPYTISPLENLYKECYEEAGIEKSFAQRAKSVGLVRYMHEYSLGGHEDIIYCYDLELPIDFVPRCTDGEVEEFYLMEIEEVAKIVKESDAFKPNCNLVIIDFLVRHGYLSDQDAHYIEIVRGLR